MDKTKHNNIINKYSSNLILAFVLLFLLVIAYGCNNMLGKSYSLSEDDITETWNTETTATTCQNMCGPTEDGSDVCCADDETCTDAESDQDANPTEPCPEDDSSSSSSTSSSSSGSSSSSTSSSSSSSGGSNEDKCNQPDDCNGQVTITCLSDAKYCKKYPGSGGTCQKKCTMTLPQKTCEAMGIFPPPSTVTVPMSDIDDKDCTTDSDPAAIKACCNAKHEDQHAQDLSKPGCPMCQSEQNGYQVSQDCLQDALDKCPTGVQTQGDCDQMKYENKLNEAYQNYQACLCAGLVDGKTQQYKKNTCEDCKNDLADAISAANSQAGDDVGKVDPDADSNDANNRYCKPYESKSNLLNDEL